MESAPAAESSPLSVTRLPASVRIPSIRVEESVPKVIVPEAAVVTACKETSLAVGIEKEEILVVPPMAPATEVLADPELMAKVCAPSMVLLKLTAPSLLVLSVSIETAPPSVTGPVRVTVLPEASEVMILPLSVIPLEPVIATVLIWSADPTVPTDTVFVVPPVEERVTSSEEVP